MRGSANLRRRTFIGYAAVAAAAGSTVSCANRKGPWRFFTIEEAKTVAAITERLIPGDDAPGAAWAGVTNYIDRHLVGHFEKYEKTYRLGLIGVENLSSARHGKPFIQLTAAGQDDVLTAMESGQSPADIWPPAQAREFFNLLLAHTMQGFYGDPRHGGNREAASWRMLGVPLIPVRGRDHYDLTRRDS